MRLAFIVQRYGTEVLGGSEHLCRLVAERLAAQHDVDVLTTCARDYVTWKNEYQEGTDRVRGVVIRRFAVAGTRDIDAFNRYSEWIYRNPHSRDDEIEWLKQQGPWCPALVEHLRRNQQQYDVLIFFTYLYATTVMGLEVNPGKSILVSTAHDEPAIRLEIFKEVFARPAALFYLTDSERAFVQKQFAERPLLEEVVGVGVDIPPPQRHPRSPAVPDDEAPSDGEREGDSNDDAADRAFPSHLLARGSMFRRRHRLYGPVVLYGGRIDPGKGCEELFEYFQAYLNAGGDTTLVLMGADDPIVPPVNGLRPLRARRMVVLKVPKPTSVTALPFLSDFTIAVSVVATICEARRFETPVSLTIFAISSCLFILRRLCLQVCSHQAAAFCVSDSIALSSVASLGAGGWPKSVLGCSTATSGMRPFS